MKKLSIILFIMLIASSVPAQSRFTDFQFGIFVPADAKTGFIGGINVGRMMDNNIGFGFEIDYYWKTYSQETKVAPENAGEDAYATSIENSSSLLPILFKLIYLTETGAGIEARFSVGVGYEFLWNREINYEPEVDVEENRFYSGFTWQVGGGINYPLSAASDVFAEILYQGGTPSRDAGETDSGLPIRAELDMSGIIIRAGLRIFGLGL